MNYSTNTGLQPGETIGTLLSVAIFMLLTTAITLPLYFWTGLPIFVFMFVPIMLVMAHARIDRRSDRMHAMPAPEAPNAPPHRSRHIYSFEGSAQTETHKRLSR